MLRLIKAVVLPAALIAMPVEAKVPSQKMLCSTAPVKKKVQDFYAKTRPGVPLSVASRSLAVPESQVASGLAKGQFIAVSGSQVRDAWKTIDDWGAQARVKLVFADGGHSFAFPSLVPLTQPDDASDEFLDVYADEGRGIHSHIKVPEVGAVVAVDMPTKSPQHRTRAIGLYGHNGKLIVAVYASLNLEEPDEKAVSGFAKSWAAFSAMPQMCG
jgi:putative heme iron utilization protein